MLLLRVFPNFITKLSISCAVPGTLRISRRLAFLFAALALPASGQTATNAPPAATTNLVAAPVPVAPAEVISEAETALTKLKNLSAEPPAAAVETDIEANLKPYATSADGYAGDTRASLEKNPSLDQIRTLQNNWKFLANTPAGWKDSLTKRATDLSQTLDSLSQQKTQWTQTDKAMVGPSIPPEVRQRIKAVLEAIDAAQKQVTARQARVLALQDQVIKQDSQATAMLAAINEARNRAANQLFSPNTVPIWKIDEAPADAAPTQTTPSWAEEQATLVAYFNANSGRFFVHGGLLVLILIFFYWVRNKTRAWLRSAPDEAMAGQPAVSIFETPISNALLLTLVLGARFYPLAPRLLLVILAAIALVPAVIILRRLLERSLFPVLDALVVFFFIQEFRSVATLSPDLARLCFLLEMLGAVLFLLWLLSTDRLHGAEKKGIERFGKTLRFAAKGALIFVAAGLLANILGFTRLGNLLCEAVQRSANLALILYAGLQVIQALLTMAFRVRPISHLGMVQQHGAALVRRVYRFFVVVAAVLWTLFTLEMFSLRTPVLGALSTAWNATIDIGFPLSAGRVIEFGLLIWGAALLSRFGRFIMECDVYPRLRLAQGVPYAISTMLHYAVLVVAFILATAVLGIDMTKFTILVSALGVGIGFGLQNIINNFVSGLILLFERPVKIGDSIQVGDSIGVVERIGIRASVLKATNGAELIVPNGSLISDRVTNWTFSGQERIIAIPLNIVRGPDIAHVMELLIRTAAENPKVLKTPAPHVLVLTLGANVSLELRAWTGELSGWNDVRSDLIIAVNLALTREAIAVA